MSGNAEHIPGAAEPHELTNPALWTLGLLVSIAALGFIFFHFKQIGREHAKGEERWALPVVNDLDHQALGADRSQAVLDRGEVIYAKNCVSCHGANGDAPVGSPPPRNFHTEAFKNPLGSGPYGFYDVLAHGYKGMPALSATPEERYAVAHYVRETFMKPTNPSYVAKDDAKVVAQIPAKGAGGAAAEAVDPRFVQPAAPAFALMAAVAGHDELERTRLDGWLAEAHVDCGKLLEPAFQRLIAVSAAQGGRLARLHAAIVHKDRSAFNAALVAEDGAGSADPFFSVLPATTIDLLYARLAATRMN